MLERKRLISGDGVFTAGLLLAGIGSFSPLKGAKDRAKTDQHAFVFQLFLRLVCET